MFEHGVFRTYVEVEPAVWLNVCESRDVSLVVDDDFCSFEVDLSDV